MKDFIELIDKLYSENLDAIATMKKDPDMRSRFVSYMTQKYEPLLERINANPHIKQRVLEDWSQTELRHWGNLSSDAKYAYFTRDAALVEIDECSRLIFSIARNKYNLGRISDDDVKTMNRCLNRMKALMANVLIQNKRTAKKLLSEAIVDADYASGETKNLSIRLSHIARDGR